MQLKYGPTGRADGDGTVPSDAPDNPEPK